MSKQVKSVKPATRTLKCKCASAIVDPAEANLKKFIKTPLAMTFVKKNNASWNHQDWLNFVEDIKKKGYDPIDTDKVGLVLEEKKAQFLAAKKG